MVINSLFNSVSDGYQGLKKINKEYSTYFLCSFTYSVNNVTTISDIVLSCSIAKCFKSFFKVFGILIISVSVIFNHFFYFIHCTEVHISYI